jgi:hypothetical protein
MAMGAPAAALQMGPDASAHILTDNLEALFNYVDISATGQVLAAGDDVSGNVSFPQGSTFFFYGAARTALRASTNGFVSFNLSDAADPTNDCPVPAVPGTGNGDRMYVLHDDLVTTVRFQHFPAASPAPGWTGAVSVIQWTGTYLVSGLAVDFELLLLHDLDLAVMQYQTVGETGGNSTTGIQNAAASTGLNYQCNTNASIYPGRMVAVGSLALNELRIDQPAADDDEFAEISGVPGFNLGGWSLIAIGDGGAAGSGVIEAAVDLTGTIDALLGMGRTFYVVAEQSFTLGTEDQTTLGLNFENQDTVTYVLVSGFAGSLGQDLDTNDDGFLDVTPWSQVVDAVSNLSEAQPPALSEHAYAAATVGPAPLGAPWHIQRCPGVHGSWTIASDDPASGADTPGASNGCVGDLIFADGFGG